MSFGMMNTKSTHSSKLDQNEISQGTYWVLEDTGEMYYDVTDDTRIKVRDIVPLENEITRLITTKYAIPGSFYYVIETKKLWFYNGNWIDLTGSKDTKVTVRPLSIQTSAWVASGKHPGLRYEMYIPIEEITEEDRATIELEIPSIVLANNAYVVCTGETLNGAVRFYSKKIPAGTLIGIITITKGVDV